MANALRRAKFSGPDPTALAVCLCAGGSGLSGRGMACLLRLRRAQLRLMEQSRGALVRIEARKAAPLLDLAACADSPLVGDFLSLLLLQLVSDYPERARTLRAMLHARRTTLDVPAAARDLWRPDGDTSLRAASRRARIDARLLSLCLWAALKPVCEAVARAFLRHVNAPGGTADCPLCGGPAWAYCAGRARCAVCETAWRAPARRGWQDAPMERVRGARLRWNRASGARAFELDRALFETAFHAGPLIELVRRLETPGAP